MTAFGKKIKTFVAHRGWLLLSAVLLVVDLGYAGWEITYEPQIACNLCHNVRPYVKSYLESDHLDNVHYQANVNCKDCHQVSPITAAGEAITFLTGDYADPMHEIKYTKEGCLYCHRSYETLAAQTADLDPNPHESHLGEVDCTLCHKSHRDSAVYCNECHTTELDLP